jgi:hypothetical protein
MQRDSSALIWRVWWTGRGEPSASPRSDVSEAVPEIIVGVDVGKGGHPAAGYHAARDRVVGRISFPVSNTGIERLRAFLEPIA